MLNNIFESVTVCDECGTIGAFGVGEANMCYECLAESLQECSMCNEEGKGVRVDVGAIGHVDAILCYGCATSLYEIIGDIVR